MKKRIEIPGHCGYKNGGEAILEPGGKKGFVCEICKKLLEIDYDGNITESPLNGCTTHVTLEKYSWSGKLGKFFDINNG